MSQGAARGAPPEQQYSTLSPARRNHSDPNGRDSAPVVSPGSGAPSPDPRPPLRQASRSPGTAARIAPPVAVVATLLPALYIIWLTATGHLGSDPIETLEHATGDWAIRFLILTLAVTPVRQLVGWGWLIGLRRTFGLAVFGYATAHLLIYIVLDMGLMGGEIVKDVLEHPWVTLGMVSWLLLLPLAITSTRGWQRRLGGRRWQRLHRLIYIVPFTASFHYFFAVKLDVRLPLFIATILVSLLGVRLWRALARRRARGRLLGSA